MTFGWLHDRTKVLFADGRSARRFTPCNMSLDIKKSAGTITAQVHKVSRQGLVAARHRKIRRVLPPESSGTTTKTQVQMGWRHALQPSGGSAARSA